MASAIDLHVLSRASSQGSATRGHVPDRSMIYYLLFYQDSSVEFSALGVSGRLATIAADRLFVGRLRDGEGIVGGSLQQRTARSARWVIWLCGFCMGSGPTLFGNHTV